MKKIKLGLAPTRRFCFSVEDAHKYKKLVEAIHDHCAAALYEATKYIPGLKPDPVQPAEDEIRAYLRGSDFDE